MDAAWAAHFGFSPAVPPHALALGADALIINPGALSHYSLALADALRGSGKAVVEVHISNVFARGPERHQMVTAAAAQGVISGLGFEGYLAALDFLAAMDG